MLTTVLALLIVTAVLSPSTSFAAIKTPPKLTNDAIIARQLPSSAVFPVYGDVYPHGLYYVSMTIGDPVKPYFLDVDTGSDLTWLQCDAPCVSCSKGPHPLYKPKKNGLVKCRDEICTSVPSINHNDCEPSDQCDYEIEYADHLSSIGVLVSDVMVLRLTNNFIVKPKLAFGCGYDQQQISKSNSPSPTDGVLGLGSGKASIISQLKNKGIVRNIFGHCLSRKKGGYLFFGDDLVPSHGVTWAPMSFITSRNYYSPGKATFSLGKQSLVIKKPVPVVFDSGSSYTYFTDQSYNEFLSELENDLNNKPLKRAAEDQSLPICWKGVKPFKSLVDVKKLFRSLILYFGSGRKAVQLEILPENYLVITKYGNACLGILDGTEIGLKDLNVIGDITMQDMMVIYDNEKLRIGWAQMNCDRLPNAEEDFPSYEKSLSEPS